MHAKAKARFHELTLQALDELRISNTSTKPRVLVSQNTEALRPLIEFIGSNLAQWVSPALARLGTIIQVNAALEAEELLAHRGPLKDFATLEQRRAVAQRFVHYWDSVPRAYEFYFPLPGISVFGEEVKVAPGIVFKDMPRVPFREQLNRFSGANADLIACFTIEEAGLIVGSSAIELAPSAALRRAKTFTRLGLLEGALTWTSGPDSRAPLQMNYEPSENIGYVPLPAELGHMLAGLRPNFDTGQNSWSCLRQRLSITRIVLAREQAWERVQNRTKKQEKPEDQFDRHCARIVSAAEWLFDAERGQASATTFVQASIGFEALYGGSKGEPVVETLANRVAYSLGTTPQERNELVRTFRDFYETRSIVVHGGATRLTTSQQQQFQQAKSLLERALQHEMSLVAKGRGVLGSEEEDDSEDDLEDTI